MADLDAVRLDLAREVAGVYADVAAPLAVALGGSASTGVGDDASDIDLYVYADEALPLAVRRAIAERFSSDPEVGNDAWEPGDEWIDARTGIHVDVMFRSPGWIADRIDAVLVRHEASIGYSTALWHNVLRSVPLVDPGGWFGDLQTRADRPYPMSLKRAIVAKNHPLLRGAHSSFRAQIVRAAERGDAIAVQHRTTALFASVFDVLFAANELPHPGEKRMLRFAMEACPKRPTALACCVEDVLAASCANETNALAVAIDALLDALDDVLVADGSIDRAGGHGDAPRPRRTA